jgi:YD repeat-containing protein
LFSYDAAGRVQTQTQPDLRQINFSFDADGNLSTLTPPSRPSHGFDYNPIGQATEYTPPALPDVAQPKTEYHYNLDKQLTDILRPDGKSVLFNYNAQSGKLESLSLPNGAQSYTYYPTTGKVQTIAAPNGNILSYVWDGSLLLSESAEGQVNSNIGFSYNNDFRLSSEIAGAGGFNHTIAYAYDNDGLLTQAGDLTLNRDAQNGLLSGTTLGALATARNHNAFGELSSETADYSGNPLYSAAYQRDDLGRITRKTETLEGVESIYEYTYDLAGRLAEVKKDGVVTETYSYDQNGNRTNENAQYDAQDRLLQYAGETYSYTENGELKSKGNTLYHYDVMGKLSKVEQPSVSIYPRHHPML